jgi:tetrahydrodipicolinate N-succinyltransferase
MALNVFTTSNQLVEAIDLCLKEEIGEEVIIAISRVFNFFSPNFLFEKTKKKFKTLHSSISNLVISINTKIKDKNVIENLNELSNNILKDTKQLSEIIKKQTEEIVWKSSSQDKISLFKEQLESNEKIHTLQTKLDQERKMLNKNKEKK